jgi:hypothetical protein
MVAIDQGHEKKGRTKKKMRASINANNNNNGSRSKDVEFTTINGVLVCQMI